MPPPESPFDEWDELMGGIAQGDAGTDSEPEPTADTTEDTTESE